MTKVYQQHPDDCLRAAICSILDLELEDIPSFKNFEKIDGPIQWVYENLGYVMVIATLPEGHLDSWWLFEGKAVYHIRSMNVKHSSHSHAVVCCNGKIVHDPCPNEVEYTGYNHDYFFSNPLNRGL